MTYKAKDFIRVIDGSGGIISVIAARMGCSWNTAAKHVRTVPTIITAYENECERIADIAVGALIKSIQSGDTQDAKWWLTKKRKKEFGDAIDVNNQGQVEVTFTVKFADEPDPIRDTVTTPDQPTD